MNEKDKKKQYRKWQLTVNNPDKNEMTHEKIKTNLEKFKSIKYYCMCDEIGENGTYHTHVYFCCENGIRFETVKNRFEKAHIEIANGTSKENKDYIRKEGKWEKDKKKDTNLKETYEEWGEMPNEEQGKRNDVSVLYEMIKSGYSDYEIIEKCPQYMFRMDKIEKTRQIITETKFKSIFRELEIIYIYGETNTGKTRSVMEQYGYENVYRVTDYEHPFDSYNGQDVIVFEEYRSSIKIQDMLNYLDGYPLQLPCRYLNKTACFTKVYIITNIEIEEQYKTVQIEYPETYRAFMRRIKKIKKYSHTGICEYEVINGVIFEEIKEDENILPLN